MLIGLLWAPWTQGLHVQKRIRTRQRRTLALQTLLHAQSMIWAAGVAHPHVARLGGVPATHFFT